MSANTIDNSRIQFVTGFCWQWWLTLNMGASRDYTRLLKRFWIELQDREHMQVMYQGVYVEKSSTGNHCHVLAVGHSHHGANLYNVDRKQYELEWGGIARNSARISAITSPEQALEKALYLFKPCNMPHEALVPYNRKLHEKYRI